MNPETTAAAFNPVVAMTTRPPVFAATLLVDRTLRVLSADEAGRAALSEENAIRLSLGRLCTGDMSADAALREGVVKGFLTSDVRLASGCGRALIISVMPIATLDGTSDRPHQAVLLVRSEWSADDNIANVAEKCRLTAGETQVLRLIYKGLNTIEVASVMEVAKTTVRTHLRHIFDKTETSRQSELVHFVATYWAITA